MDISSERNPVRFIATKPERTMSTGLCAVTKSKKRLPIGMAFYSNETGQENAVLRPLYCNQLRWHNRLWCLLYFFYIWVEKTVLFPVPVTFLNVGKENVWRARCIYYRYCLSILAKYRAKNSTGTSYCHWISDYKKNVLQQLHLAKSFRRMWSLALYINKHDRRISSGQVPRVTTSLEMRV
jgi:hypothetical protein